MSSYLGVVHCEAYYDIIGVKKFFFIHSSHHANVA